MGWFTHDKWWFSSSLSVSLQYLVIFNTLGFHSPTLDIRCLPHTMVTERCSSLFDGCTFGYTLISEPPNNSSWVPCSSLLSSRLVVGRMAGISLCLMGGTTLQQWMFIAYSVWIQKIDWSSIDEMDNWCLSINPLVIAYCNTHLCNVYIYNYIYVRKLGFVIK